MKTKNYSRLKTTFICFLSVFLLLFPDVNFSQTAQAASSKAIIDYVHANQIHNFITNNMSYELLIGIAILVVFIIVNSIVLKRYYSIDLKKAIEGDKEESSGK